MGVKNPKAKYPLPDDIHPEGLRCFQVLIPDEPHYVAAFRGAMLAYASPISWQDDPEHKAKQVGEVLAPLIADMETCEENALDVRQNPTMPCILEKRPGAGDWEQFANLQLCPPKMRLSNGELEWWDGEKWVKQPGSGDERYTGETTPPWPSPPPGETGNCLSAENITSILKTQVTQWIDALTAGAIVMTLVLIITGILTAFLIPPATPAIIAFCDALIAYGATELSSHFTNAVYDRFKCIVNCHAQSDGSITVDAYDAINEDIDHEVGEAWPLIKIWLSFFGPVGLTRMAKAAGITDGTCDDCECGSWCYYWDFTQHAGDFHAWAPGGLTQAYYVPGVGWYQTDAGGVRECTIICNLSINRLTRIAFTYHANGSIGDTNHWDIARFTYTDFISNFASGGLQTGEHTPDTGWFAEETTYPGVSVYQSNSNVELIITAVRLWGNGPMPEFTGGIPCEDIPE